MGSNNCYAAILLLFIHILVYFSKILLTITHSFRYLFGYGITAKRFGYFLGMGIQRAATKNYRKLGQQHSNLRCKQYWQMEPENKNTPGRRTLHCTN